MSTIQSSCALVGCRSAAERLAVELRHGHDLTDGGGCERLVRAVEPLELEVPLLDVVARLRRQFEQDRARDAGEDAEVE